MKAKFDSGITPPRGKFQGGVYQSYSAGHQLLSNKRNSRSRYPNQFTTAAIMAKVTRAWAFLTSGERDAWNVWAATYPQPCRYRSGCYLTGYQNFLQRNFYELLFFGINAPLITNPALSVVADSSITPVLSRSGADLLLNYSWSRSGGDIWAGVFVSHIISQGKLYNLNFPRFVGVIDNGGGFVVKFGCLYNPAVYQSDLLAAPGSNFICPSSSDWSSFISWLGGSIGSGGQIKSTGFDYWLSPNTGATNSQGWNGRGSGYVIASSGLITSFKIYGRFAQKNRTNYCANLTYNNANFGVNTAIVGGSDLGFAVRLLKKSTSLSEGSIGSYTGNDGKIYSTKVYNGWEWMTDSLCETKLNDNSLIQMGLSGSTWTNASGLKSAYPDNDIANAFSSGSTSAELSEGWGRNFGVLPAVGDYVILRFVKVGKSNGQFLGEEQFTIPVTA